MNPNDNSTPAANIKQETMAASIENHSVRIEETATFLEETRTDTSISIASNSNHTARPRPAVEKEELPRCPDIPDVEDFDEDEIFCRMATDENIFNSRGLSHAPKLEESSRDRYRQMGHCAQMHCYEWSNTFPCMNAESNFPIVQVRFKNTHKDFFRIPDNENPQNFQTGDIVTVESTNGHDTGIICLRGELVRLQLKKKGIDPDSPTIRRIYRKARQNDIDKWIETIQAEKEMQRRARIIAAQLGLSMKINNVEIQGDFTKAIFYYTADDRVDFRQLIKLYAEEFKLRIEMRQIGARQESGILGGIGSCGRELCCVSFLHNFTSVGTHTARIQQVSLNPQKLAGQCSKLKCCLNFEYEVYMDALQAMPDSKTQIKTEQGDAHCIKMDPLKRTMTFVYNDNPGTPIDLKVDKVLDIIEKNKAGESVSSLQDFAKGKSQNAEPVPEFQQVVGQDDLTRFDKPKDNRKHKDNNRGAKKKNGQNPIQPILTEDKSNASRQERANQNPRMNRPQGNRERQTPADNRQNASFQRNPNEPKPAQIQNASGKNRRPPRPLQKPILKPKQNDGNEQTNQQ